MAQFRRFEPTKLDFVVLQPDSQGGLEMEIVEVKSLNEPDQAFKVQEKDGITSLRAMPRIN